MLLVRDWLLFLPLSLGFGMLIASKAIFTSTGLPQIFVFVASIGVSAVSAWPRYNALIDTWLGITTVARPREQEDTEQKRAWLWVPIALVLGALTYVFFAYLFLPIGVRLFEFAGWGGPEAHRAAHLFAFVIGLPFIMVVSRASERLVDQCNEWLALSGR